MPESSNARLERADVLRLIEERGGPEGLDLSGQDLSGLDLSGVDLHGAILARADLREADLRRANLQGADLSRAVLRDADLRWADLCRANLCRADLRGANLRGADLEGAQTEGADFAGAELPRARPQQRLGTLGRPALAVLALVGLTYVWGWLYKAAYLAEFGLPEGPAIASADYLLRGLEIVGLSLGFFLMLPLLVLYALLMLAIALALPLAFAYLGDRLLPRIKNVWARRGLIAALVLAYLVTWTLAFPYLVPVWNWLVEKGIPAKGGFRILRWFLATASAVEKGLMAILVAAALMLVWILYRLLCRWLQGAKAPYPWLRTPLAYLRETRLFSLAHPLTVRERRWGSLAVAAILIAVPTFLTQAGGLQAQEDMCFGGDLPQVRFYAKRLAATGAPLPVEEVGARCCLRLLLAKGDKYYVFYPHQTREVEGRRVPRVYEVAAEEVVIVYREREDCLTCHDAVPPQEEPPLIVMTLATPTPTPTATPVPPTPTPTPPPPPPTPTFTPPPPPPPTPTPTPPPPPPTYTPAPTPTESGCLDEYEPDDVVGQQKLIAIGETQTHSFCPEGDFDLVMFPVKAGRWYRVYTHDLALGVDTMISVGLEPTIARYCQPSNCANDDAAPGDLSSEIIFQADADGTALVSIDNRYQHGPDKTYKITVEEIVPTPTPTPTVTPTPTITPTPVPPKDPWEPNNSFGQAFGPLASGQTYEAYISSSGDKDYYRISIESLDPVTILLEDIGDGVDYDLYFYNANYVEIARSAGGPGQDEEIIYHPSATGTYYILVWSPTGSFDPFDEYELTVTFGPPPTPTFTPTPTLAPPTETPTPTETPASTPPTETPTATVTVTATVTSTTALR